MILFTGFLVGCIAGSLRHRQPPDDDLAEGPHFPAAGVEERILGVVGEGRRQSVHPLRGYGRCISRLGILQERAY